jgi:hypothetical protein
MIAGAKVSCRTRVAAMIAGMLAAGAICASSAVAHESCVWHGGDKACNHGTGYPYHHQGHYVDACDHEYDFNRVRAHWNLSHVQGTIIGGWDPDDSGGICQHQYNHPNFGTLWRHRICEQVDGCSGWRDH